MCPKEAEMRGMNGLIKWGVDLARGAAGVVMRGEPAHAANWRKWDGNLVNLGNLSGPFAPAFF